MVFRIYRDERKHPLCWFASWKKYAPDFSSEKSAAKTFASREQAERTWRNLNKLGYACIVRASSD